MRSPQAMACDSDADLALLGQSGFPSAMEELFIRCWPRIAGQIASLARRRTLQPADEDDLRQQAYFAFLEAIGSFRAGSLVTGELRAFAPFLAMVVRRRMSDLFAAARRREGRLDHSLTPEEALERGDGLARGSREGLRHSRQPEPPEKLAEGHEFLEGLEEILGKLPEHQRQLWEWWNTGETRAAIAARLDLSTDQAKRRIRAMLVAIGKRLGAKGWALTSPSSP